MNEISALSKLGFGAQVMVIGLVVVFVGLCILILATKLLTWIIVKARSAREEKAQVQAAATPAQPAPTAAPAIEIPAAEDDAQLIAVISAAIAAYSGSAKRLVVRSVRKAGAGSAWANAGRRDQLS